MRSASNIIVLIIALYHYISTVLTDIGNQLEPDPCIHPKGVSLQIGIFSTNQMQYMFVLYWGFTVYL